MNKKDILELLRCKLKSNSSLFYSLTEDIGFTYSSTNLLIILSSKVKYKRRLTWKGYVKVPYKTKFILEVGESVFDDQDNLQSFELSIEEFNCLNESIKYALDFEKEENNKKLNSLIQKELAECPK